MNGLTGYAIQALFENDREVYDVHRLPPIGALPAIGCERCGGTVLADGKGQRALEFGVVHKLVVDRVRVRHVNPQNHIRSAIAGMGVHGVAAFGLVLF